MSTTPSSPPPPEPEVQAEGGEEQRAGLTPRTQKVANVLTKLAATARSFLLYDPRNAAIHQHLTTLLEALLSTLAEFSQIELTVQPFEVMFEGQAVYVNRDREKSLAFRLYRDGVRGLTFRHGFDWEQLSRLLEVLSVRYTGVHQNEDDMVTLLWKANFKQLEVVAVEGFVPEDQADGSSAQAEEGDSAFPELKTLPVPVLPRPEQVAWLLVPDASLEALRAEALASALPSECWRLIEHLRTLLADPRQKVPFSEVTHVFAELRDFLLSDEHLGYFVRLLRLLKELASEAPPAWDPERPAAVAAILASCGDQRAVQRLIHSVPGERRELQPQLVEAIDLACAHPLDVVLSILGSERSTAARAVGRQLLEHYGASNVDEIVRRFKQATGTVASDLLRVLAHAGGAAAATIIAQQCSHPAREVQEEAVWHLERMPYSGAIGRYLFDAYRRGDALRDRLLALMIKSGDRRFVELLARDLTERAGSVTPEQADEMGRILGRLGGPSSVERWQEWLRTTGLLKKTLGGPLALQVAAGSALAEIPGEAAAAALRAALVAAAPEAHRWLGEALARHAHGPGGATR